VIELTPEHYHKAKQPLAEVAINTLFAEAVVGRETMGKVYADSLEEPRAFLVVHPYGMSLLFGDSDKEDFYEGLKAYLLNDNKVRDRHEWLQAYPEHWYGKLEMLLGERLLLKRSQKADPGNVAASMAAGPDGLSKTPDCVLENGRVNFRFHPDKFKEAVAGRDMKKAAIVPVTLETARAMPGAVTPASFWSVDGNQLRSGIGYSLLEEGLPASMAFAAFHTESQIEIGIETVEASRGKGYAFCVCAALIEYCLEHGLEPVWSCRRENEGSYHLANSLGFEPVLTIPYYRLVV
jgi:L-amino acid N-acyltransferase YncA